MGPGTFESGAGGEGEVGFLFGAVDEGSAVLFGNPVDFGSPDAVAGVFVDAVLEGENGAEVLPVDEVFGFPNTDGGADGGDVAEADVVGIGFTARSLLLGWSALGRR